MIQESKQIGQIDSNEFPPQSVEVQQPTIQEVIAWAREHNLTFLPVAPAQDPWKYPAKDKEGNRIVDLMGFPQPQFTGKNPSYLDRNGKPHPIKHSVFVDKMPTKKHEECWFANPANGIGILMGSDGRYVIDLDAKHFDSPEALKTMVDIMLEQYPQLKQAWRESTPSGGDHLMIKLPKKPDFTNFALSPGGEHVGEVLGCGRFCVLAPTKGGGSQSYKVVNTGEFVEVESLESIGIYDAKAKKSSAATPAQTSKPKPSKQNTKTSSAAIHLEELIGGKAKQLMLDGPESDRSESLSTIANEAFGWQNYCSNESIALTGTPEDLLRSIGESWGIDSGRIDRIIATIDHSSAKPSCEHKDSSGESAQKKIQRLQGIKTRKRGDRTGQAMPGKIPDTLNISSDQAWNPVVLDYQIGEIKLKPGEDGEKEPVFIPLTNFDIRVNKVFTGHREGALQQQSSDAEGGYILDVMTRVNGQLLTRQVVIRASETTRSEHFENAIKRKLGDDVFSLLTTPQVKVLLHIRRKTYEDEGGKRYKLIDRYGQQPDGTWVFKDFQFTKDGHPTDSEASGWLFNPSVSQDEAIPVPNVANPSSSAIKHLMSAAFEVFPMEAHPHLMFMMGWGLLHANYHQIFSQERFFPALDVFGEKGAGKTLALRILGSLFGIQDAIISGFSESMCYEYLKRWGSIPLLLDDPIPDGKKSIEVKEKVDNLIWKLFNACPRVVRGNHQQPHGSVAVTSNMGMGGRNNDAVDTRMLKIKFPDLVAINGGKTDLLKEPIEAASGGLPQLMVGYDRAAVAEVRKSLVPLMPRSNDRLVLNMALLVWGAQRFSEVVGLSFNALEAAKLHLIPITEDLHTRRDSLEDFISYLKVLKSESKLGENLAVTVAPRSGDHTYTAIYLKPIWEEIQKRFNPNFGLPTLYSLVEAKGGFKDKPAKFVNDRDTWNEYVRAKARYDMNPGTERSEDDYLMPPIKPNRSTTQRALWIPTSIFDLVEESTEGGASYSELQENQNLVTSQNPYISRDAESKLLKLHKLQDFLEEEEEEEEESTPHLWKYSGVWENDDNSLDDEVTSTEASFSGNSCNSCNLGAGILDLEGFSQVTEHAVTDVTWGSNLVTSDFEQGDRPLSADEWQQAQKIADRLVQCQSDAELKKAVDSFRDLPREVKKGGWKLLKGNPLRKRIKELLKAV